MLPPFLVAPALLLAAVLAALQLYRHLRPRRALRGAHVWVVGASRGIGRALCISLAKHGAIISLSSRDPVLLHSLSSHLGSHSGVIVPLDVTTDPSHLHTACETVCTHRPLDVVVFNAGVNHRGHTLVELHTNDIDSVIDTNLRAPAYLAQIVHPMLRASRGAFVVISSLAGYRGLPGASVYGASKSGVTTLCEALAIEWRKDNIDVTCIHPGFVNTSAIKGQSHPKPFLMSEQLAAEEIVTAIRNRISHAAFPWIMEHVVMRFARLVPTPVYNFVIARTT